MKWIIEVEEMVKVLHQVVVEIEDDSQIDEALNNVGNRCCDLDTFVDDISDIIPIIEVNEEYYSETESLEYSDDYEADD